jgi:hypothetical protein
MRFWLPLAVSFAAPFVGGCIDQVASAVVDNVTDPGGKLEVQIGDAAPVDLPALAQGNPMSITAQSPSLVAAFTCAADASGQSAATVLATAGGQITLSIQPQNGNQLQVHTGGQSYVASTGTVTLMTNSDGSLSGSFDAMGAVASGAPVELHGTLTSIPQAH